MGYMNSKATAIEDMLCDGYTYAEIAEALDMSVPQVKAYITMLEDCDRDPYEQEEYYTNEDYYYDHMERDHDEPYEPDDCMDEDYICDNDYFDDADYY